MGGWRWLVWIITIHYTISIVMLGNSNAFFHFRKHCLTFCSGWKRWKQHLFMKVVLVILIAWNIKCLDTQSRKANGPTHLNHEWWAYIHSFIVSFARKSNLEALEINFFFQLFPIKMDLKNDHISGLIYRYSQSFN